MCKYTLLAPQKNNECIHRLLFFLNLFHQIRLLPLAHVFEILSESLCMLTGVPVGYSSPLTLTDSSSKTKRGCKGDVTILKPTCMISVPVNMFIRLRFISHGIRPLNQILFLFFVFLQLILDRVAKEISSKVNSGSAMQKALFQFVYDYKRKWTQRGYRTPLFDLYV